MPGLEEYLAKECTVEGAHAVESEEQERLLPVPREELWKPWPSEEWLQKVLYPRIKWSTFSAVALVFLLIILTKVALSFISDHGVNSWTVIGGPFEAGAPPEGSPSVVGMGGAAPGLDHESDALPPAGAIGSKGMHKGGMRRRTRPAEGTPVGAPVEGSPVEDTSHLPRLAIPELIKWVGAGNQLIEFASIALFARYHNFSMCVPRLYHGPSKHTANYPVTWIKGTQWGYKFEELFNLTELARFVPLKPMEECLAVCNGNLTGLVEFRPSRGYEYDTWTPPPREKKHCCKRYSFLKWLSVEAMGESSIPNGCISMSSIFPGLTWRGAYLASYAFLQPSAVLGRATDMLLQSLLGQERRTYMAVHWRFEESSGCIGHSGGLCFFRCPHGIIIADADIPLDIIANGSHVLEHDWEDVDKRECPPEHRHLGVKVTIAGIAAALVDAAKTNGLDLIYLASDGWIRGKDGCSTMQQVITEVRRNRIEVVGLWQCPEFSSQFHDGTNISFASLEAVFSGMPGEGGFKLGGQALNVIEQEVCVRAHTFMGSGQSSWSMSVWRTRIAHRKRGELAKSLATATDGGSKDLDNKIISELLKDRHMAGMSCMFLKSRKIEDVLTHEFEASTGRDLWLDYMACEARKGKGVQCEVGACW